MGNKEYQGYVNQAISSIDNLNIPEYQLAGMPEAERQALEKLQQGQDYSQYQKAQQLLTGEGESLFNQGNSRVNQAGDILDRLQNMSQSDYQNMLKNEYNSDLVNSQLNEATQNINDYAQKQEHALDQSAVSTGNLNSSRAGVAQGVIVGNAAKAIGSASVQLRTAEESAAQSRLMSYLNLQGNTAGQLANVGQYQTSTGLNMYGQGMNYYSQYNAGQLQNLQNGVNAGNIQRAYQQQQYDVSRQNSLLSQSPSLARLAYANQYLLPLANLSQISNGTVTNTQYVPQQGMLGGLMSMGGMALGNYLTPNGASDATASQNMQFGGMAGGMIGNMFSR